MIPTDANHHGDNWFLRHCGCPTRDGGATAAAMPQRRSWCEEVILMPTPVGSIMEDQILDTPAKPR